MFVFVGLCGLVLSVRAEPTGAIATVPTMPAPAQEAREVDQSFHAANSSIMLGAKPTAMGGAFVPRRQALIGLIRAEAARRGLPVDVADAVAYVESGYNPHLVGSVGEIGLMQVRPETATMLGFRGDNIELSTPEVNIRYGVDYLARAWRIADGNLCRALMKYRAGHGEEVMTARSVEYCRRAKMFLQRIGSTMAAGQPLAVAAIAHEPATAQLGARPRAGAAFLHHLLDPAKFWAAHEARIRLITARVHKRWRDRSYLAKAASI